MMDKRVLRRSCFSAIRALGREEKTRQSRAIIRVLETSPVFARASLVFSYLALSSEPDLDGLTLGNSAKTWAFSRVRSDGKALSFHEVRSKEQLREGAYGFLEPDPERCPVRTAPDLVLVPGVGFNPENGARLGRGKGHYDRFLAPLVSAADPPEIYGVCFDCQLISLTPESHDIPMNGIVTPDGILSPESPS